MTEYSTRHVSVASLELIRQTIAQLYGDDGVCRRSNKVICEASGLSLPTVKAGIATLLKDGLVLASCKWDGQRKTLRGLTLVWFNKLDDEDIYEALARKLAEPIQWWECTDRHGKIHFIPAATPSRAMDVFQLMTAEPSPEFPEYHVRRELETDPSYGPMC